MLRFDLVEARGKRLLEEEFGEHFDVPLELIWEKPFTKVVPASSRPYGAYYCGKLV